MVWSNIFQTLFQTPPRIYRKKIKALEDVQQCLLTKVEDEKSSRPLSKEKSK